MENTKENVTKIIIDVKPDAESRIDEGKFITEGVLDSLDIMRLIMGLENKFDIEIDPEDVLSDNFESVEAIMALVDKCRG